MDLKSGSCLAGIKISVKSQNRISLCCRNRCENKTLCMEKLSLVLPETPPYFPRHFGRCAVIGNSGDLLKTKFGNEIDGYEVVIRENGAPIQVCHSTGCFLCSFDFIPKIKISTT